MNTQLIRNEKKNLFLFIIFFYEECSQITSIFLDPIWQAIDKYFHSWPWAVLYVYYCEQFTSTRMQHYTVEYTIIGIFETYYVNLVIHTLYLVF